MKKNNFILMDIFNKKKVKALEAEVEQLKHAYEKELLYYKAEVEQLKQKLISKENYYRNSHNGDIKMITDLQNKNKELKGSLVNAHTTITDLHNKLTLATRLNEIYESKPNTETLEKSIEKNESTINMYIEREQAYIKRIEELENQTEHMREPPLEEIKEPPTPIEDYNYGGKIPKRDSKTGRFVKG